MADLGCRPEDRCKFPGKPMWHGTGRLCLVRRSARACFSEVAVDVLHHNDGGIDNQAKIDRTNREKIGGLAPQYENADGEEQRERDGRGDNCRAP